MKKLIILIAMMIASPLYAADNEIYITQSGATANIDIEQLGSGNIIGGLSHHRARQVIRPLAESITVVEGRHSDVRHIRTDWTRLSPPLGSHRLHNYCDDKLAIGLRYECR